MKNRKRQNNIHSATFKYKEVFLSLFIIVLMPFSIYSQVKAVLDTSSIKIGEEIKYRIEVTAKSGNQITFPDGQSFLPLEVIEFYPEDTTKTAEVTKVIKQYGLTQFDSGRYVIPQQRVLIDEVIFYTDTLVVEIADVVVDTLVQKMYDIKPDIEILPPKTNFLNYLIVILLLLVAILIIYILLRYRRKLKEESKRRLPPLEEALVALQSLDNTNYLKENRVKDYYSSLTEIVKRYLDREVDEAALESTTDELLQKLELHKDAGQLDFDKQTLQKLGDILKRADLIKFAKMQAAEGQARLDRSEIESIIKETHEAIPEPTEEEKLKDAIYQEELLKKKKKKKIKRVIASAVTLIILTLLVLFWIYDAKTIKDTLLGNYSKSLLETTWIRSEYGNPSIIIETPKVLLRHSDDNELSNQLADQFSYGNIKDKLYIYVSSIVNTDTSQVKLEQILETKLILLEESGATNLIVMDEPFSTEKGVKGIKASGDFNIKLDKNKFKRTKSEYELIIFAQNGSIQQLLIVIEKEDLYGSQIKDRILRTLEIEVNKP